MRLAGCRAGWLGVCLRDLLLVGDMSTVYRAGERHTIYNNGSLDRQHAFTARVVSVWQTRASALHPPAG